MTIILAVTLLLFGVPWWTLLTPSAAWPTAVFVTGTLLFAAAFAALPVLDGLRPRPQHLDWAAATGDTLLGCGVGAVRVVDAGPARQSWSCSIAGVERPDALPRGRRSRRSGPWWCLLMWGYLEAMRVPRVQNVDVAIPRLGPGLDGLRVVVITDTHYGPINRARWSAGVAARVNALGADIVCHAGDIADGAVDVAPRAGHRSATIQATSARVYVTGNHEYFSEAQGWLDHMESSAGSSAQPARDRRTRW